MAGRKFWGRASATGRVRIKPCQGLLLTSNANAVRSPWARECEQSRGGGGGETLAGGVQKLMGNAQFCFSRVETQKGNRNARYNNVRKPIGNRYLGPLRTKLIRRLRAGVSLSSPGSRLSMGWHVKCQIRCANEREFAWTTGRFLSTETQPQKDKL
jgi:hypothetical protein